MRVNNSRTSRGQDIAPVYAQNRLLNAFFQRDWSWILTRAACGLGVVFGILQVVNVPAQLMDFATFAAAGRAALTLTDPYARTPVFIPVPTPHVVLGDPNLNAPVSAFLFAPFALLPLETGLWIFRGLSVAAYAASFWLARKFSPGAVTPGKILWAASVGGVWSTLANGQIYVVLMLALVAGLVFATRGHAWKAALLVGLVVAVKPNFLVLPILLFLAGHRSLSLRGFASTVLFGLLPVLAYGPGIYWGWVRAIVHADHSAVNPINVSLIGAGIAAHMPVAGWIAALVLLALSAVYVARVRPDAAVAWEVGTVAALLAAPETLAHYSVFLVPFLLARPWTMPRRVAAGIFLLPPLLLIIGPSLVSWLGALPFTYTIAFVLCLGAAVFNRDTTREMVGCTKTGLWWRTVVGIGRLISG